MRLGRKSSIHSELVITILAAIIVSWVVSTGISNYAAYLSMKAVHREMLAHPEIYPVAMPEPSFTTRDFFLGSQPFHRGPGGPGPRDGGGQPQQGEGGQRVSGSSNDPGAARNAAATGSSVQRRPDPGQAQGSQSQNGGTGPGHDGPPAPPPNREMAGWILLAFRIAVGALIAIIAGTLLNRRFTRPLADLAGGALAFHSGDLKHRIPVTRNNEFGSVGRTMNEMAERLSDHIQELEDDARRRREFLANVAHELRSPVTTMRTMAGALDMGLAEDPERRSRATKSLVRTSERLLRLVTDLLELARLDLRELPMNPRVVDLREIVAAAVQSGEMASVDSGVRVLPIEPGPPVIAAVDPDRMQQVLDNLIGNAIAYAGGGSEVRVSLKPGDPTVLTVADNGKGIPSGDLPFILDPFFRGDTARTPGGSHMGLGLSIAHGIVHAHGGRMSVTSTEGKGVTATIELPCVDATLSKPSALA